MKKKNTKMQIKCLVAGNFENLMMNQLQAEVEKTRKKERKSVSGGANINNVFTH